MGTLTPPGANPVQVRYWNTVEGDTPVSHCHIVGERLFCCGLDVALPASSFFSDFSDEPKYKLDELCQFVVDSLTKGVQVGFARS